MSGTTITAEERALWRAESRHEYAYFSTDGARLILALDALEQAEARAERAESAQLELCQRLSNIARELCCAGDSASILQVIAGIKERAEKAEAMVDWLADACAEHCHDKCGDDARCSFVGCEPVHCNHATTGQWKAAARRAVAAGEETCPKQP